MLNTIPLKRRMRRFLAGKPQTYQEVSDKHWILCPAEESHTPSAIYLDGELDKVTGVVENLSFEFEAKRIKGTIKEHRATIAYQLTQAYILDGYVYKGAMKYALASTQESFLGSKVTDNIPKAALACTWCGNRYFFHFMCDDLPLTLAAQQLAEAIVVSRQPYKHEPDYRHLLGTKVPSVKRTVCDELIIIDDVGQNQFKRKRYENLRSSLKRLEPLQTNHGVMILRGTSGSKRLLKNEIEIAQFLQSLGFSIIDPEKMSVREIASCTLGAKLIVGVEGSHLAHGIFSMADGGTILTLQPPDRFHNIYKDYTDCMDMHYAFVVGQQVTGGFTIEPEDLARTLDKIEILTE